MLLAGVPCHDPGHVVHASRIVSGLVYEDNITFTCDSGFEEDQGNFTLHCNMYGNWTSGLPSCKSKLLVISQENGLHSYFEFAGMQMPSPFSFGSFGFKYLVVTHSILIMHSSTCAQTRSIRLVIFGIGPTLTLTSMSL